MADKKLWADAIPGWRTLAVLVAFVIGAYASGAASRPSDTDISSAKQVAVASAIAAITPAPTPEPTPIPTPWIVAPQACLDAIQSANLVIADDSALLLDILKAYLDHPSENLTDFGRRVESLLTDKATVFSTTDSDAFFAAQDLCQAAAK